MRPQGRGPLDSLYFDYPQFTAPSAGELARRGNSAPVIIVGAGPIGMTAALTLARYGVASILLDRKPTFNDGSRAICIARASIHILDRIGAAQPFLEKSLGWQFGRSYFRGRQIYRLEMPHSRHDKFLPMYNLQQQYIEAFLHDAVTREPLIDMRWQSDATDIVSDADGVTLTIASPNDTYRVSGQYVLAADGARSAIRSMLGLRLKGANYEGKYVIADVRMAHDFPTERRAFFEPAGNPGGTVLIHRQPDDIWRIDYQLRAGERDDEAIRESSVRDRVDAILADIGHAGGYDLEWWSIYTANTLCLDDYKHGRVLFIGDSAHIVPIFGVRGLNNGLADAHNAGWKLGYVLNGHADARLLDSYSVERRGATLDVFANATKSTRFMTPPTRGWRLAREAALSLALRHDFARDFANPRQMQPYTYGDSPLTTLDPAPCDFEAGPLPGAHAVDVAMADGRFLLDGAGDGFAGLLFLDGPISPAAEHLFDALGRIDARFSRLAIDVRTADGADAATRYGAIAGTFYLLRPDLHVAARWRQFDGDAVVANFRRIAGGAS